MRWALQKMSLELIRVVNQETKEEGGCRTRNGEALISAFWGYYTKNAIWQEWSSIKRGLPKKGLKQRQARVVSLSYGILKYCRR
jgi:hypothetical protein